LIQIRDALPADIPQLLRLMRALAEAENYGADFAVGAQDLEMHGFGAQLQFFTKLAVDEERAVAVGMAVFYLMPFTYDLRPTLVLKELYVDAAYRDRGVGERLMVALAQCAQRLGCGRLRWDVLHGNHSAERFYQRLGGTRGALDRLPARPRRHRRPRPAAPRGLRARSGAWAAPVHPAFRKQAQYSLIVTIRPAMLRFALCAITLTLLVCSGLSAADPAPGQQTEQKALYALDRLGYGPRPGDLDRVMSMGVDTYINEQLAPEKIAEPPELQQRLDALDTTRISTANLFRDYGPPARKAAGADEDARKKVEQAAHHVAEEAQQARLLRALYSPAQLQEVMTDFWFNHFNVFRDKGIEGQIWVGTYERDAIRPYALGHFRDLLGATAKHPAMLYYLDNWQSSVPHQDKNGDLKGGLNENYAREVMELHTLGVDGGYTQKDVTELARILTGWTYLPRELEAGTTQPFAFDPKRHDFGDKHFLGKTFNGADSDGEDEGERALDLLARSPATAKHISYQLAQYFVADQPPPELVQRLSKRFRDSNGDIREVLRTLFHSKEFWDAAGSEGKFKTPYRYVVSAVRASGINVINFKPLLGALNQFGMPLYGCQTPDGYKNIESAWLNPDAMVYRLNFANALGNGNLPLYQEPQPAPAVPMPMAGGMPVSMNMTPPAPGPQNKPPPPDPMVLQATLGNPFSLKTSEALASAPPRLRAGMILGSPEFMRY